jgi:hypothetical protein
MTSKINYLAIAISFTGDQPLAYAIKDDGSLVVIAHTGQKFRFSADQVAKEAEKLTPKPKPASKPAEKPQAPPAAKKPTQGRASAPQTAPDTKKPAHKPPAKK